MYYSPINITITDLFLATTLIFRTFQNALLDESAVWIKIRIYLIVITFVVHFLWWFYFSNYVDFIMFNKVVSDYNGYTSNNAIRENKSIHCDCYWTGFEGSVNVTEMMRSNENNVLFIEQIL